MVGLVGLLLDRTDETSASAAGTSTSAAPSPSVASATVAPAPLSTTSTLAPVESPAEFLALLAAAYRSDDVDFLASRLNPAVIERFGEEACRANLTFTPDPTAAFTVKSVECAAALRVQDRHADHDRAEHALRGCGPGRRRVDAGGDCAPHASRRKADMVPELRLIVGSVVALGSDGGGSSGGSLAAAARRRPRSRDRGRGPAQGRSRARSRARRDSTTRGSPQWCIGLRPRWPARRARRATSALRRARRRSRREDPEQGIPLARVRPRRIARPCRHRPASLRGATASPPRLSPGLRARGRGRRAAAARARLARDQADLLEGDRAAGRCRVRGDRPRPARLRRLRRRPDGFHDVPAHSRDLHALVHDHLGHRAASCSSAATSAVRSSRTWRCASRMGRPHGAVQLAAAVRQGAMAGMRTRPAVEASDYFVRQGTDADGLAAELDHARAAAPLHRDLLHVAVLGAPGRVHGARRRAAGSAASDRRRLPHRAVRRRRQAAGQLRRLRERVLRRRAQRAPADGDAERDACSSSSARATT